MHNETPFFSIIVPIYNEEQFIQEALDSILAQTDSDWEALLIDDGSTDSTPGILDEYAKKDPRFRVFHKPNGGQSTAINKGVDEARGEWLCWLSGDDYFHPQKLELNRRWIQDYSEARFFFSGFWLIEPGGKTIAYNLDWLNIENSAYHLISLFRCNYVMGISICIERESWRRNGGFDEKLRYAHDLDMWLRLMLNTPTKYLSDRTCTMRSHAEQESARFPLAGLFDSSKSAIRLINDHVFADFFPTWDLHDHRMALDALFRTLQFVANEPTSNYYMLGFHPLLHLRILEWIWGESMDPILSSSLKAALHESALQMESAHQTSYFGFLWKAIRVAVERAQQKVVYFPCEPHRVGELNYYLQQSLNADVAQPLRTYLERFDGLSFEDSPLEFAPGSKLVLLLPPDVLLDDPERLVMKFEKIWMYFVKSGCSVLLVGRSKHIIGLMNGILFLGWNDEEDEKRLISALGNLDTVVAFSRPERLEWAKAERLVAFELEGWGDLEKEIAIDLLKKIQSSPRQYRSTNTQTRNSNYLKRFLLKRKQGIIYWRSRMKMLFLKYFSGG